MALGLTFNSLLSMTLLDPLIAIIEEEMKKTLILSCQFNIWVFLGQINLGFTEWNSIEKGSFFKKKMQGCDNNNKLTFLERRRKKNTEVNMSGINLQISLTFQLNFFKSFILLKELFSRCTKWQPFHVLFIQQ